MTVVNSSSIDPLRQQPPYGNGQPLPEEKEKSGSSSRKKAAALGRLAGRKKFSDLSAAAYSGWCNGIYQLLRMYAHTTKDCLRQSTTGQSLTRHTHRSVLAPTTVSSSGQITEFFSPCQHAQSCCLSPAAAPTLLLPFWQGLAIAIRGLLPQGVYAAAVYYSHST